MWSGGQVCTLDKTFRDFLDAQTTSSVACSVAQKKVCLT